MTIESKGIEWVILGDIGDTFRKTYEDLNVEPLPVRFDYDEMVELEEWMLDNRSWLTIKDDDEMEFNFEHIEDDLALEAWMMQTFWLEDKILEEELELENWMLGDPEWFTQN